MHLFFWRYPLQVKLNICLLRVMLGVKCQPIYKITPNCIKTWTAVSHRTVAWSLQTNQFLAITNTPCLPSLTHLGNCCPIRHGIQTTQGGTKDLFTNTTDSFFMENWFPMDKLLTVDIFIATSWPKIAENCI